ncbi:MAG: hypothetical protein AABY09_06025 [Nanoarchaeota archaeon]
MRKGLFVYSPAPSHEWYIKVYNDLMNSSIDCMECLDYGCFNEDVYSAANYIELTKNFTLLYCRLRDNGFYHPRTVFMLRNDSKGLPSMICLMPELKPGDVLPLDNPKLKESIEDYIRTEPNVDMIFNFNYGVDGRNNTYCLDLHVFRRWPHNMLKFKPQR